MTTDLYKVKRNRLKTIQGQETVNQIEHMKSAGAKLVMSGILVPGRVSTADTTAAGVLVRAGSVCRIQTSGDTYVAFGAADTMAAVTASTSPGLKLVGAGVFLVVATDDFIRTDIALTRLEILDPETDNP